MRDITTITEEEVREFLDATVGGEYAISKIERDKKSQEVAVGVVTKWGNGSDEDPLSEIEDEFIFGQYSLDEDKFPDDFGYQYGQFLLAKGFIENPFIDTNLLYAAKDMYEALKELLGGFEMLYAEALADAPDRTRIIDIANNILSRDSMTIQSLAKAEGAK